MTRLRRRRGGIAVDFMKHRTKDNGIGLGDSPLSKKRSKRSGVPLNNFSCKLFLFFSSREKTVSLKNEFKNFEPRMYTDETRINQRLAHQTLAE